MVCCSFDEKFVGQTQEQANRKLHHMREQLLDSMYTIGAFSVCMSYESRAVEHVVPQYAAERERQAQRVSGWAAVDVPAFEEM